MDKNRIMDQIGKLIFVCVLLFSCQQSQDTALEKMINDFQEEAGFVFLPKENNENDFFPPIDLLEKTERDSLFFLFQKYEKEFQTIKKGRLSEKSQALVSMYHDWLTMKIASMEEDAEVDFNIFSLLKNEVRDSSQTNEEQFLKILKRIGEVPLYFSKTKQHIKNPSKTAIEKAIAQYSKDYFYLKNDLPLLIRKPDILKEDQIDFSEKNKKAQMAVKDFLAYLNSHLFEINDKALFGK